MNYSIVVLEKNDDINDFCEYIKEYNYLENGLFDRLKSVFESTGFPCTIVCEFEYVDKFYRDSYYHYFAGKHFYYERNCKRLSIFKGKIEEGLLFDYSDKNEVYLNSCFIGTIVLKPINIGKIGRCLLDPCKLNIKKSYLRLTSFDMVVIGHIFKINAFPYSSQDSETMTCAETTVWSILEYYGNRYSEYKSVLPSDIYNEISRISNERVWPSKGLEYEKVSDLLKTFGFSPRLYAAESYGVSSKFDFTNCSEYHRIFHYYVESGIPFAVGIIASDPEDVGHSMVCIGHSSKKKDLGDINSLDIDGVPYVDSADYYTDYIMIDDNRVPYVIDDFYDISEYGNDTYVDVFAVPLYKRIMMEASDARAIISQLLQYDDYNFNYFLRNYPDIITGKNNPVVVRLFLTSSRKYKHFRAKNSGSRDESEFYANCLFPKFLWVAEISTHEEFENNRVLGEIVLDATFSISCEDQDYENSVILIRYFSHVGYAKDKGGLRKYLDENGEEVEYYINGFDMILDGLEEDNQFSESFQLYVNNLQAVGEN